MTPNNTELQDTMNESISVQLKQGHDCLLQEQQDTVEAYSSPLVLLIIIS